MLCAFLGRRRIQYPSRKTLWVVQILQIGLAQIEARAGAPEEAIKRLRRLLSIPAGRYSFHRSFED